jgi:hypothetical protein
MSKEYVGTSVANYSHGEWAKFEEVMELGRFLQEKRQRFARQAMCTREE